MKFAAMLLMMSSICLCVFPQKTQAEQPNVVEVKQNVNQWNAIQLPELVDEASDPSMLVDEARRIETPITPESLQFEAVAKSSSHGFSRSFDSRVQRRGIFKRSEGSCLSGLCGKAKRIVVLPIKATVRLRVFHRRR
jgi:hypothetical protein